jgi:hypothetical protein
MWKRGARVCDRRVMVPGHLWIVIVWEGKREKVPGLREGRKHVHVDDSEPLALVLTPAACQALCSGLLAVFWQGRQRSWNEADWEPMEMGQKERRAPGHDTMKR